MRSSCWLPASRGLSRLTSPTTRIRDRLLQHVSLYRHTATAGSSAFTGYATSSWGPPPESSGVPTAFLRFAHDIGIRQFVESEHRIERSTDVDHGGHFAAMEEPGILVEDLRTFFRDLR